MINKSKEEYLGYAHEAGWYEPKELVVQYSLLQDLLTTHSQNREADIRKEERANIKRKIDKVINDPETTAEIRVGLGIACGFVRWYGEKNSDTPITKDNLK